MTSDQPAPPPIAEREPLAVLRERNFRWFLASRFCSATAMTGLRAAIGYHLYTLTGSTFQLGLLGAVQFVPALSLSLVGGAFADAHDRRRIAQITQSIAMAGAALLAAVTALGGARGPLLFGVVFVLSVAAAFENPARQSLLPLVVSRARFAAAVPVYSTMQALAFMLGPTLVAAGVQAAYACAATFSLVAIAGLAVIRPRQQDGERRAVSLRAIREGVAYVRSQPVLLGCMTLDMFAVIFAGASALLPVYAKEILVGPPGLEFLSAALKPGELRFGILSASLEAGALLMSVALMLRPPIRSQGRALLMAVTLYGFATIGFGISRSFWLSVGLYMLAGMADQVSVVMRSTIVQLTTPDALRGRVSSINMIFIGASNQLGAMESGFVAALTSATFAVVSGGAACLAVVTLVASRVPALRRYRLG